MKKKKKSNSVNNEPLKDPVTDNLDATEQETPSTEEIQEPTSVDSNTPEVEQTNTEEPTSEESDTPEVDETTTQDKKEIKLKPIVEKDEQLHQDLDKSISLGATLYKNNSLEHEQEYNKIISQPKKNWPLYKYPLRHKVGYFFKWLFLSLLTLLIIGGLMGLGFFYYMMQQTVEITNQNFFVNETSVNIYDINKKFITTLTQNNSDWVELCTEPQDSESTIDQANSAILENKELCVTDDNYNVSQFYIDGVISTEDAGFYEHAGVDFIGMVKATIIQLTTGVDRGGSTVTMQLGKLLFMDDWVYGPIDPNTGMPNQAPLKDVLPLGGIQYKLLQMAYAMEIEVLYNKAEIFENYMNSAYFGVGGFGIENASKYYYGKSSKDLELHEAAVLAGMPQMPNDYNPYTNPELTLWRRDIVLGAMLSNAKITQEQYDEAVAQPISAGLVDDSKRTYSDLSMYRGYLDIVQSELETYFPDYDPQSAGLDVYTYLVPDLQEEVFTLQNTDDYVYWPDEYLQSGLIQIDSQNGAIYSIGSGKETSSEVRNNYAYNFYRQPGSTAKPIVAYGPGFEYGQWSTWHNFNDKQTFYSGGGPEVFNAGSQRPEGSLSLYAALPKSKNTTAVQAFQEVANTHGVEKIQGFMSGLGLTDTGEIISGEGEDEVRALYEAYAIGGWMYGTTPYEMAAAYATFANGGVYNQPHAINYIEISENSPYYEEYGAVHEYQYESHRAMQESTAFLIADTLKLSNPNAQYVGCTQLGPCGGPGIYLDIPDHSAKTGTTDLGSEGRADLAKDKWAVGFTPNVTTAVWVGYDENSYSKQNPGGYALDPYSSMADMIYKQTTAFAYNNENELLHDSKAQEIPSNIETRYLKPNSANPYFGSQPYYFIAGSDDLKKVDGQTTTEKPNTPVVEASINADKLNLSWGYDGKNREKAKWKITIDSKDYKTISENSITISMQEISKIGGCSPDHEIGVQLIDVNENNKEITSDVNTQKITKVAQEYCEK